MIYAILYTILCACMVILCIIIVWFATYTHRMSEEGLREGVTLCLAALVAIILDCVALYVGTL